MDNKQLGSLDPKLKEAYDRVMGVKLPQNQQAAKMPQPAQEVVEPVVAQIPEAKKEEPHESTVHIGGKVMPQGAVESKKKGISPVIIILGVVVFLLIYAVIWVKVLNVPLPFSVPFLSQ